MLKAYAIIKISRGKFEGAATGVHFVGSYSGAVEYCHYGGADYLVP